MTHRVDTSFHSVRRRARFSCVPFRTPQNACRSRGLHPRLTVVRMRGRQSHETHQCSRYWAVKPGTIDRCQGFSFFKPSKLHTCGVFLWKQNISKRMFFYRNRMHDIIIVMILFLDYNKKESPCGDSFLLCRRFYARLNIRASQRSSNDPATATMIDVRLNPVTSTPSRVPPIHPPTIAPTIPNTIEPRMPPLDGCGSI